MRTQRWLVCVLVVLLAAVAGAVNSYEMAKAEREQAPVYSVECASPTMGAIMPSQVAVRLILLGLALVGCGLFAGVAWRRPERRLLFVAPLSWMVNVAVFYMCRLAGWPADVLAVNMWSQVIHFHALILLVGGLLIYERE